MKTGHEFEEHFLTDFELSFRPVLISLLLHASLSTHKVLFDQFSDDLSVLKLVIQLRNRYRVNSKDAKVLGLLTIQS
jgi:hypothetical protein